MSVLELGDQPSVTTWTKLRRSGFSEAAIKAQIDAGRWRRHGFAIVRHNGPLTRREIWFVARAHAGPQSALTAFTAAELCGLRGWERDVVHVLTPSDAHVSPRCPVTIRQHRVRDWNAVRGYDGGPVQIIRQSLLVAAATFASPRPACGLLAAATQQRLVATDSIRSVLTVSTRVRHRAAMLHALDDIDGGAQALSEIDFVRLCRRHGLPVPEQQVVRREPNGRRRYLDAAWRRRDGRLVVVEVDGALHLAQRRWWDDQLRQNEVALTDALVLRYPSPVVRHEPATVVTQLRRALLL